MVNSIIDLQNTLFEEISTGFIALFSIMALKQAVTTKLFGIPSKKIQYRDLLTNVLIKFIFLFTLHVRSRAIARGLKRAPRTGKCLNASTDKVMLTSSIQENRSLSYGWKTVQDITHGQSVANKLRLYSYPLHQNLNVSMYFIAWSIRRFSCEISIQISVTNRGHRRKLLNGRCEKYICARARIKPT